MPTVQIGCDAFETTQVTQPDGTVANRLRVEVTNLADLADMLRLILIEMRVQNTQLGETSGLADSIEELRSGEEGNL